MKTLVLYASTYGLVEEMAIKLGDQIEGEVDCINLMENESLDLAQYDKVVIGGSIYMGQIQKKMKQFCIKNTLELTEHSLYLFLCCGIATQLETYLENAFPKTLLDHSSARISFGGALDLGKMKFVHRALTKMMLKNSEKEGRPAPKPKYDAIEYLAKTINTDIM